MDIPLGQSLGSFARYVQEVAEEGTSLYFDQIPENFRVPAIYFEPPQISVQKATLSAYRRRSTVHMLFFHSTDNLAYRNAARVQMAILLDNCNVPLVSMDGKREKRCIKIGEPELERIENGVTRVTVSINEYIAANGPYSQYGETVKIRKIFVESALDSYVYLTWEELAGQLVEEVKNEQECDVGQYESGGTEPEERSKSGTEI